MEIELCHPDTKALFKTSIEDNYKYRIVSCLAITKDDKETTEQVLVSTLLQCTCQLHRA